MNKEIKELIELVQTIANRAYWSTCQDCGCDYDEETCIDCKHKTVCRVNTEIMNILKDK